MQTPSKSAAYTHRVTFGQYVTTRLRKAKREDLAAETEAATQKVKASGRAAEDAAEPVQTAMAIRDALDHDMDTDTQDFRMKLASRSLNASKEAPYTSIFNKGIGYYIAAPWSANVSRYEELITRVESSLPEADEERIKIVSAIQEYLPQFKDALTDLASARTALAIANTESDAADDEWETVMEKTYGLLIADYGKRGANRFFPKRQRRKGPDDDDAPSTDS